MIGVEKLHGSQAVQTLNSSCLPSMGHGAMTAYNAFYAQSGGPTAVINASACGLIETARHSGTKIASIYAGRYGILGGLKEDLIDTHNLTDLEIQRLYHTPGAAFGSCRYQLGDPNFHPIEYERLLAVFKAHCIRYFFYNGGGDSQDTTLKLSAWSQTQGYPLTCIGIPKTIDNDLPLTDNCPGFGSVAKYTAIAIQEASLDVASMCGNSTQVFILEVMGRHTGWIAAAGGLASQHSGDAPQLILFPEIPFSSKAFLERVSGAVRKSGFCTIVAAEGIQSEQGDFIGTAGERDAFGHPKLGSVAPKLAELIREKLKLKSRWAVSDYLQRSARHIASRTDVDQAYALGKAAIELALQGKNAVMTTLIRKQNDPYQWTIGTASLSEVANLEKALPRSFITPDGFHITPDCRAYLLPLIQGEAYPPYHGGLPDYFKLNFPSIPKKLPPFFQPSTT